MYSHVFSTSLQYKTNKQRKKILVCFLSPLHRYVPTAITNTLKHFEYIIVSFKQHKIAMRTCLCIFIICLFFHDCHSNSSAPLNTNGLVYLHISLNVIQSVRLFSSRSIHLHFLHFYFLETNILAHFSLCTR